VGEAGTIASTPCIVNGVCDALSPFGVRHIDMPLKPERVWKAIHTAQSSPSPKALKKPAAKAASGRRRA
jgi:carbon-monoxide dehydrogenase large subunit